MKKWINRK